MHGRALPLRPYALTRFQLRTFLFAVLLTGVASGVSGSRAIFVAQVLQLVPEIERRGGQVHSDFYERYGLFPPDRSGRWRRIFEWTLSNPAEVTLLTQPDKDSTEVLRLAGRIPTIRTLRIVNISDRGLKVLQDYPMLATLHIENSQFDDAGVYRLSKLPRLRHLDLVNVQVNDTGFLREGRLPELDGVRVRRTYFTHESLRGE